MDEVLAGVEPWCDEMLTHVVEKEQKSRFLRYSIPREGDEGPMAA
jgi:hypothetical protein